MKISKYILFCLIIILLFISCKGLSLNSDIRPIKIKKFLTQKYSDSPLIGHEQEMVYCADKFNLDYRLYVAISGVESTFGRRYPKWSKNLTGYGIYRDKITSFKSIYQNIYKTNELIAISKYYKKYRKTKRIEDLAYIYKGVPPFKPYIANIKYIMRSIDNIDR